MAGGTGGAGHRHPGVGSPLVRAARRAAGAAALCLVLIGGLASPASAHATLVSVDPADGARLDESPAVVILTFSERVSAGLGGVKVLDAQRDLTGGRGPDVCIDAVGLEAHGTGPLALYDRVATGVRFETDRGAALREALIACRKGGTVSLAGVYGGYLDKLPLGAAFNKALRLRMGQTHVHRYLRPLLERVQRGELDARQVITHHLPLEQAPYGYEIFRDKEDECIKVVLQP